LIDDQNVIYYVLYEDWALSKQGRWDCHPAPANDRHRTYRL